MNGGFHFVYLWVLVKLFHFLCLLEGVKDSFGEKVKQSPLLQLFKLTKRFHRVVHPTFLTGLGGETSVVKSRYVPASPSVPFLLSYSLVSSNTF